MINELQRFHIFTVWIKLDFTVWEPFKNPLSCIFGERGVKTHFIKARQYVYRESIFHSHSSFLREEDWREFRRLPGAWGTSTFRFDHCTTPVALSNSARRAAPCVKFAAVVFAIVPVLRAESRRSRRCPSVALPFHALTHLDPLHARTRC